MRLFGRAAGLGLVVVGLVVGCGSPAPTQPKGTGSLSLIAMHPLNVLETSGLTFNDSITTLWTVSDRPGRGVYQLDMLGNIVKKLQYVGEDVEGIAFDHSDRTLWVVEEGRREIVHLDLSGAELSRKALGLTGPPDSGLEGICLDHDGHMFVLNQKEPGLFVELKPDHSIASQETLSFAPDYSDISSSREANDFWIVSSRAMELYLWNKLSGVVREYPLPFPKPEGVCVDEAAGRVYVVSDSTNTLYVYKFK